MSSKRRPLRYVITSALLIGPAISCGPDVQTNPVAPLEEATEEPIEEPENTEEPVEEPTDPETPPDMTGVLGTLREGQPVGNTVAPTNGTGLGSGQPPSVATPVREPRPRVNTRRPRPTPRQPEPTPNLRAPEAPSDQKE